MRTLLILIFGLGMSFSFGKEARPNVLLIIVDDLRPELTCYGASHVQSPHIDRFAGTGMVFERAYCSSPVCGPSRASMLTGTRLTKRSQYNSASVRADNLFPDAWGLARYFKEQGYTTVTAGKVFHHQDDHQGDWTRMLVDYGTLRDTPEQKNYGNSRVRGKAAPVPSLPMTPVDPESFRHVNDRTGRGPVVESPDVPDEAYNDGKLAQDAVRELARLKAEGKPFFFACGFVRPHLPFYAPKKYWDLYKRDEIPLAPNNTRPENAPRGLQTSREYTQYDLLGMTPGSEQFARTMKHGYLASVSYVDAQIGKVLDALRQLGLDGNTIVVLWGDHGWNLGEHSFWGKHNLVDTATRLPLIVRVPGYPAGRNKNVVESVDILPTLCDLTSIPVGEVGGTSLKPLLASPAAVSNRPAYSKYGNGKTVITDRFSYTEYGKGETVGGMLFDHGKDKGENKNVAQEPEYASQVEKMKQLLHDEGK